MTDSTKTICTPIFDLAGIRIKGKGITEKYQHLKLGIHIIKDKKEIPNINGQNVSNILQKLT